MKVFLVNDEKFPPSVLTDCFLREGFEVRVVRDQCTEDALESEGIMVFDMPMPFPEGLALLRQATQRARRHAASLADSPSNRLIESGTNKDLPENNPDQADDPAPPPSVSALHLDESQWLATMHGKSLGLTRREFRLLYALARHPGRIYTRGHLLQFAYDQPEFVNERAVDSHIKNLRRKLAAIAPTHNWIRSYYGIGFSFQELG